MNNSLNNMPETVIAMSEWQATENTLLFERLDVGYDHVVILGDAVNLVESASGIYGIFNPKNVLDKEAAVAVASAVRDVLINEDGTPKTGDDVLSGVVYAVERANQTMAALQKDGQSQRGVSAAFMQVFEDRTGKTRAAIASAGAVHPLKAVNNNGSVSFMPLTPNKNNEKYIDGSPITREGDFVIDIIDIEDSDTIFLATAREAAHMLGQRNMAAPPDAQKDTSAASTVRDRVRITVGLAPEGKKGDLRKNVRPARLKLGALAQQLRGENSRNEVSGADNPGVAENRRVSLLERYPRLLGALAMPAMMAGPGAGGGSRPARWRNLIPGIGRNKKKTAAHGRHSSHGSRWHEMHEDLLEWVDYNRVPLIVGGTLLASSGLTAGLVLGGVVTIHPHNEQSSQSVATSAASVSAAAPTAHEAAGLSSGAGNQSSSGNQGPRGVDQAAQPPTTANTPAFVVFSGDSYEWEIRMREAYQRLQVPQADFDSADAHAVQEYVVDNLGPDYLTYIDAQGNVVAHNGKPNVYPINPANADWGLNFTGPARFSRQAMQLMDQKIIQLARQHDPAYRPPVGAQTVWLSAP